MGNTQAANTSDTPDVNDELLEAAGSGDIDRGIAALAHGASTEANDEYGRTALIRAARSGHSDTVTTLLIAGADLEASGRNNWTSLTYAARGGHGETLAALLAAGARLEAVDNAGATALMYAAFAGHADVVRELLAAGARLEARDSAGSTALMYAANGGSADAVTLLLSAGANAEAVENEGRTALMHAAGCAHGDTVAALVAAGADIEAMDNDGGTVLLHATFAGCPDVVGALLRAGAGHQPGEARRAYSIATCAARRLTHNDRYRTTAGDLLAHMHFRPLADDCFCDVETVSTLSTRDDVISVTSSEQVSSVRSLADVWELEGVGRLKYPAVCTQIRFAVLGLIERVCEEISATAPDFACKPVLVGSTANHTQAGLPDGYDFMFELEKLTGKVSIEETVKAGVVTVNDGSRSLSVDLNEQFVNVLCPALAKVMKSAALNLLKFSRTSRVVKWNKVCTQFNFVYVAGKAYNNLPLSVDITPSIHVSGKPAGATDRFPADYHYHVVPKHVVGSDEYWLICSAKAESLLITEFPPVFRQALVVAKALLYPRILVSDDNIQRVLNGEPVMKGENACLSVLRKSNIDIIRLFIATRYKPKILIDSHILKLSLLHVQSTMSPDDSSSPEKLSEIVRQLFMFIEACQTKGELKHPLIPSIDVFAEDKGKLIEHVPAGYLRMKAVKAVLARLEDGPLVSNSGLLQLSAEEVWQQMQHSVMSELPDEAENIRVSFTQVWNLLCDIYDKTEQVSDGKTQ
ncbi:PREDICTED: uncharacterized protein LOC106810345 [Priapulus caudatus]|uniref:Uncharacterized protein LOC106810345 n=1 Tax=Priapulus caudatus TaxID=37621 RepID=A0ABM1EAC5_PRICU|nr:PREDICTED: uncharacterized protein LOC106810345 [Priapulus caudatus]XP_014669146.1 PREDICTED: uncharacterized protein LOC106810345 [Priapulus caudatus]